MSTGTSARRVRSALAVHSVLLGFAATYLSIMVLSFAAVRAFEPRLPVEARNLASYWLECELVVIAIYLAWIALPRQHRMRYALETLLPIGLVVLGIDAAGLTATLWFNLDATAFQMPLGSLPGLGLMALGAFSGWRLGRNLGDRATSTRLRREAASNRRSAWFAETSPDGSWRRATGITTGLIADPADPPGAGDVLGLRPRLAPAGAAAGRRSLGTRGVRGRPRHHLDHRRCGQSAGPLAEQQQGRLGRLALGDRERTGDRRAARAADV